ncbi:MAG: acetate--CoA ligase family protein, partial [Deltaproteobacteria bacterium]|nr:acetate--CoA ligase family protein [Deltaproteobacteria bacterium]
MLAAFGVPAVQQKTAKTPAEAAEAAKSLGFPVAVKGLSETLTHKTEKGLVR